MNRWLGEVVEIEGVFTAKFVLGGEIKLEKFRFLDDLVSGCVLICLLRLKAKYGRRSFDILP
jgi:hypothetical protein